MSNAWFSSASVAGSSTTTAASAARPYVDHAVDGVGDGRAALCLLTVDTPDGVVVRLGATEVAAGARMFAGEVTRQRPVLVDGLPGHMTLLADGTRLPVIVFTVAEGRITAIHIVIDPAKLASVRLPNPA